MPKEKNSTNTASPDKYLCPACHQGFGKTVKIKKKKGVYCPNCKTKLTLQRGKDPVSNKFTVSYNLGDPGIVYTQDPSQYEEPEPTPEIHSVEILTNESQNPQIVLMNDGSYRVIYIRASLGAMIRCPKCKKAIWKNSSLAGDADYICARSACKAETKFIFLRDGNLSPVIELLTVPQSR